MAYQAVNVGAIADDHTGDPGRIAFQKVNANFVELYANVSLASVTYFGADTTGVADSAAAFNAAVAASLYVFIPPGTYKIASPVLCTARPVTFIGAGRGAVTLKPTTSTDAFVWSGAGAGGGMKSCTMQVNGITGGYALSVTTQGRWLAEDMNVTTNSTGAGAFYAADYNSVSFRDIWINGNYGTNGTVIKLYGSALGSALVCDINNVVYGGSGGASSTSSTFLIVDGGVATVDIRHSSATACYAALVTTNSPGLSAFAQFIQGEDFQADGIYSDAIILGTGGTGFTTGHNFNKLYVHHAGQNNTGAGAGKGTGVYLYNNCRGARFQGGDILTCNLGGMFIDGNNINVADVDIRKNSQDSVGTYPGVQLGANSFGCNIHHNTIGANSGAATADMSYGVQLDAGSKQNIVVDNYMLANTLGAILNNSTDTNNIIDRNLYAARHSPFNSSITPTALSATHNNYNPTSWSVNISRLLLTPAGGGSTINGIFTGTSASTWMDGAMVLIRNLSTADNITFTHLNGGSNAWNQFSLAGAASLVLGPLASRQFMYNGVDSKWNAI